MPRAFAEIFRKKRREKGWSVSEVCQMLAEKEDINISPSTLYGYENSSRSPNAETLLALLNLYDIPILEEVETPPENQNPHILIQSDELKGFVEYAQSLNYFIGKNSSGYYVHGNHKEIICSYQDMAGLLYFVRVITEALLRDFMYKRSLETVAHIADDEERSNPAISKNVSKLRFELLNNFEIDFAVLLDNAVKSGLSLTPDLVKFLDDKKSDLQQAKIKELEKKSVKLYTQNNDNVLRKQEVLEEIACLKQDLLSELKGLEEEIKELNEQNEPPADETK